MLRFHRAPVRLLGDDAVEGIEVERTRVVDGRAVPTGETEQIRTGLVLRAIGYRARPVPGLPFDEDRALVPNDGGRVEPGLYVGGWIKRGATGFLGTNKSCSKETVERLLDDLDAGLLPTPRDVVPPFAYEVDHRGWLAIDRLERLLGETAGRPRVKLTDRPALRDAAAASRPEVPAGR